MKIIYYLHLHLHFPFFLNIISTNTAILYLLPAAQRSLLSQQNSHLTFNLIIICLVREKFTLAANADDKEVEYIIQTYWIYLKFSRNIFKIAIFIYVMHSFYKILRETIKQHTHPAFIHSDLCVNQSVHSLALNCSHLILKITARTVFTCHLLLIQRIAHSVYSIKIFAKLWHNVIKTFKTALIFKNWEVGNF